MSTLAKSGHLFELHRVRTALEVAIRFYKCRRRQIRRSIRRQWWKLFFLRVRELCPWSVLNCGHLNFNRRGCRCVCNRCGHAWFLQPRSSVPSVPSDL